MKPGRSYNQTCGHHAFGLGTANKYAVTGRLVLVPRTNTELPGVWF